MNNHRKKQDWSIGNAVKVGFMQLVVLEKIPTPDDGMPDKYLLASAKGKRYEFTPYFGLQEI